VIPEKSIVRIKGLTYRPKDGRLFCLQGKVGRLIKNFGGGKSLVNLGDKYNPDKIVIPIDLLEKID